jgi:DNA (cytosine-5)-methyltransferase 1
MRHVDLCSGIGGFSLGFEWAGLSSPVLFCDVEPWCRQVLSKHWPDVPVACDVKELASDPDRNVPDCDILTAGYPCQPFSLAGKRGGEEDPRHIWPYILRIVASKRPSWCVFENVYGHLTLGLDQVLLDLEAEGYATRPFIVPACSVDAPHRRDRVWIIAKKVRPDTYNTRQPSSQGSGSDNRNKTGNNFGWSGQDVADTKSTGLEGRNIRRDQGPTIPRFGESGRTEQKLWLPEPGVGRVANGIPRRVDRLKGLGNAIVPQIAMRIGATIKAIAD